MFNLICAIEFQILMILDIKTKYNELSSNDFCYFVIVEKILTVET